MKGFFLRWGILLVAAAICGTSSYALATEKTVIIRVDLGERADFDRFCELELTPFFRIENVFFVELDPTEIPTLRRRGIPFELIDDEPFSGKYYFATSESIVSRKMPATSMERLAEVGGYALYKAEASIDRARFRQYGFAPYEVGRREIPLVYMPNVTSVTELSMQTPLDVLDSLIQVVDQDSIYAYNTRLEAFQTRYTFADSNIAAREWIRHKFEDFGYTDITFQEFWAGPYVLPDVGWAYNVVCVKPGTVDPDKVIVIGAHYDSIILDGNDPFVYAPGADDNASGTSAVLEAARVLADIPLRKTVIFVALGAEENGLDGAWHFSDQAVATGMDIELMINLDMVGFTGSGDYSVSCFYYGSSQPYTELMGWVGEEYTWILPNVTPSVHAADHLPFYENGFHIAYNQEGTFNLAGWHTALDLTSRMDFPYLTEVTRMMMGTAYAVTVLPAPVADIVARDVGDGGSLQVQWEPSAAPDIIGYRVYWGATSEVYTDSLFIDGNDVSSTTITGLLTGQTYYVTVIALGDNGYESLLRPEIYGTPLIVPLPPADVWAEPGERRIDLTWASNQEMDFDFYRIYRAEVPGVYALLADNWDAISFTDSVVTGGIMYEYVITAVDADLNESERSTMVSAAPATFDQGILIVDQTPPDAGNPTTAQKETFFDAVFAGLPASYYYFDPAVDDLNKSIIGQYNAVFWFEDGNAAASWDPEDIAKIRWYLEHETHLFLAGWRVAFEFAEQHSNQDLEPGNFLYDYAGVNRVDEIYDVDFKGALGQVGWPDGLLDPAKVYSVWNGKMGWIGTLGINPASEVIYLFNSHSGDNTGAIVGVRQENVTGKMIFLSVPFYYLYDADAQAIIAGAAEWFDLGTTCDCSGIGDCNADLEVNSVDVVYLINYALRLIGPPPPSDVSCPVINRGDYDCDGMVGMLDVVKLINYVYRYPAPGPCDPCPE